MGLSLAAPGLCEFVGYAPVESASRWAVERVLHPTGEEVICLWQIGGEGGMEPKPSVTRRPLSKVEGALYDHSVWSEHVPQPEY